MSKPDLEWHDWLLVWNAVKGHARRESAHGSKEWGKRAEDLADRIGAYVWGPGHHARVQAPGEAD